MSISPDIGRFFSLASFSVVECRAERRKKIRDEKIIQEGLRKIGKKTDSWRNLGLWGLGEPDKMMNVNVKLI